MQRLTPRLSQLIKLKFQRDGLERGQLYVTVNSIAFWYDLLTA